jgi:hypothetical protein
MRGALPLSLAAARGILAVLLALSPAAAQEPEPPFERLLELNARELFGGQVTAKDGRVTVTFPGKGTFNQGFRSASGKGRGFLADLADVKDHVLKGAVSAGIEEGFSFAAVDSGEALSKFEMADDFKISFKLRTAVVQPTASIAVRVNQQGPKSFLQTSFFRDIVVADGSKPRTKRTDQQYFIEPPGKWLVQKEPAFVTVELVFKDKKLSSFVTVAREANKPERLEVVSQDGIESPSSGKVSFKFSRVNFGVSNLVIEGKLKKEWAEAEIAKLRKAGKLKLKPDEPPPEKVEQVARKEKRDAPAGKKAKGSADEPKKPSKPRKGDVNIDEPDPEAEVDL